MNQGSCRQKQISGMNLSHAGPPANPAEPCNSSWVQGSQGGLVVFMRWLKHYAIKEIFHSLGTNNSTETGLGRAHGIYNDIFKVWARPKVTHVGDRLDTTVWTKFFWDCYRLYRGSRPPPTLWRFPLLASLMTLASHSFPTSDTHVMNL